MEKRPKLLFLLLFAVYTISSQTVTPTVISGNGGYSQSAQGSVAWTIGEPVSETYTSSTIITTMGFHQPEELDLTSLIKEQGNDKTILVYPNPVQKDLIINFGGIENGEYQLELVDGLGRMMLKTETSVEEQSKLLVLSLKDLSGGNYYLKISRNAFSKTIKINKLN